MRRRIALEPSLHAARKRHPGDAQQQDTEHARRAQHPGQRREELCRRVGGGASQAHAVDHPRGEAGVRGRVGGDDNDEQRDHSEDGQGGEAYGPLHELELLTAPVEVLEPDVVPDPLGAPEHRAVRAPAHHRRTRPSRRCRIPLPPAGQRREPRRPPPQQHDRRIITKLILPLVKGSPGSADPAPWRPVLPPPSPG